MERPPHYVFSFIGVPCRRYIMIILWKHVSEIFRIFLSGCTSQISNSVGNHSIFPNGDFFRFSKKRLTFSCHTIASQSVANLTIMGWNSFWGSFLLFMALALLWLLQFVQKSYLLLCIIECFRNISWKRNVIKYNCSFRKNYIPLWIGYTCQR